MFFRRVKATPSFLLENFFKKRVDAVFEEWYRKTDE